MDIFDIKDYMPEMVYEYVPHVKRVGNKLNFRCPICGDGKKLRSKRGWFYIDTGSYFCWNAGCPANSGMSGLMFLSAVSGKSIQDVKAELFEKSNMFSSIKSHEHEETDGDRYSKLLNDRLEKPKKADEFAIDDKLMKHEWSLELPDLAKTYIESRKLDRATFLPKWFRFYYDNKLRRIVIPWSNDYYQERTFLKSQKNEDKYKFPPDVEKPIFGLDMIDENFKFIFILEGVFDSIWCKNGVAAGSLKLSNHQKDILENYRKDYRIVWMPDNQLVDESSRNATRKIVDSSPFEEVFIWPKTLKKFKDVNESVIYSDKLIDLWKSEKFLTSNVHSGVLAKMSLN
jgi:hypothetical protein